MSTIVILLGLAIIALVLFLTVNPSTLAFLIRRIVPMALIGAGAVLMLLKQAGLGSLLLFGGLALFRRMRGVGTLGPSGGGGFGGSGGQQRSSVRSAALEMQLDHETGAMNGLVLVGAYEGKELDLLEREELFELRSEIADDGESLALLDAYLDRRLAGWREDAHADADAGQGSPASSGPMGKKEAYEVLGLSAGASVEEIRKAHRRLMKTAHPDSGGSTFLAAKINEAKDVLLGSHS
ncbi:MAG: DnaJ domain-containing protein [Hyphomicrobiales bacterium]|nr:DnaJ domain-containing protein [Hyphomicrobiales bacterium]